MLSEGAEWEGYKLQEYRESIDSAPSRVHCITARSAGAALCFRGGHMSYAYNVNEDVHHRPQGPQGRAAADPPMIYTIVQRMPIEADGRLRYRIKSGYSWSSRSMMKPENYDPPNGEPPTEAA